MKKTYLTALLLCGCLTSFRSQAVPTEYDWSDSSDPSYTGEITLNSSSGTQTLSAASPIVSYSITADGTTFTSANSTLVGNFLSTIMWDPTMIDIMALQITLNSNSNNIPALSVSDSTINGAGGKTVDGEWDAVPNSVPDTTYTLPLFAIGLTALGWYYLGVQRQKRPAVSRVKRTIR